MRAITPIPNAMSGSAMSAGSFRVAMSEAMTKKSTKMPPAAT
ncbi:hypothetical protein BRCON_0610 [Candidatus Sumerlaea chitinivorans]|uniref:Uncharacterized protein n=1 Tax=Sumerlaea chitinivorans TaxID=2250252 RepID=A0A2Z4Y2E5_SUMC1|nr:hypothetical protein BRCON_0610 [Candidatus Sumerlaea chitinivorans]